MQQPTGDVIQDVRNLIDTANSHSNVLNDLVLAASTDPGEDRRERDRPLLAELKNEMLQVKEMFPGLLAKLSTLKTPESEQLMVQAFEAHEQIEVCLDMERQVCSYVCNTCRRQHDSHCRHSVNGIRLARLLDIQHMLQCMITIEGWLNVTPKHAVAHADVVLHFAVHGGHPAWGSERWR